jgi:xylan 1,4-beta-xylosidase
MAFLTKQATPKLTTIVSLIAMLVFLPLMLLATREVVTLITRAAGTPANITIDTKAVLEPIRTDFYHAYAQGGEEQKDMLAPVVDDIKALKPKLIRLDHLYDSYHVVGGNPDALTYNWTELDGAVDSIIATGAKPILALSYMPSVIAKDGVIINPPNDWNQWAEVVQRTIEHYSGKSGKNLSGVYYEVWNEPDLAQFGSWKYSGEKSYITLYQYAATGAKNAQNVNRFFLGGPATTGLYKGWIMALIGSGFRIDFLSWHTYQRDPKRFDQDQRNLISWLLPYPGYTLIPKLITEFGFTGDKDAGYGTLYGAAHAAAVIRQLMTGGPTYAFSFQPKDGPNQENGTGWGFITHETNGKRKKPRYFIFNFLDRMAGNRLNLTGEGSWITGYASIKDGVIRVLLVNFDTRGTHTENVPVTFGNLEAGTYTYRQLFFQGQDVTLTESVTENTLSKTVFMPASSVVLLELTRQP